MVAVSDKRLVKAISGDGTRASKQKTEKKSLNLEGKQHKSEKNKTKHKSHGDE